MATEEDDQTSLFGSPSTSRSPSPALALPTGGGESLLPGTLNVGTIALPGSQQYSELPKDPLAPSLSHPQDARPSPSAQYSTGVKIPSPATSALASRASAPPSRSRVLPIVQAEAAQKKRKRKTRTEARSSPSPSIALPDDPSAPLPPNFLRNQTSLLGTAGLVARLKPAKMQFTRGCTPTNPIVLDDDDDKSLTASRSSTSSRFSGVVYDENETPRLGKSPHPSTPSLEIDPTLLPAPTNREIVDTLIKQKDIFPVLQSILKLIAGQKTVAPGKPTSLSENRSTWMSYGRPLSAPATPTISGLRPTPLKRRKLNRVPAGAADWDVPYPFQEGEGPSGYRQTWEKERSKQLITQLMNLIRRAAKKAATRKYLRQQKTQSTAIVSENSSHSVQSSKPQLQPESGEILLTTPPANTFPPQPIIPPDPTQEASLDQLISSLIAATSATATGAQRSSTPESSFVSAPSAGIFDDKSGDDINDTLIDSWMNIFQTFPLTTSALDFNSHMQPEHTNIPIESIHAQPQTFPSTFPSTQTASQLESEQFLRDIGLDPDILVSQSYSMPSQLAFDSTLSPLPHPQPRPLVDLDHINSFCNDYTTHESEGTSGSTVESPMPSASSARSSSADPSTPASAVLESIAPEDAFPLGSQQDPTSSQGEQERRFSAQEKGKWTEKRDDVNMDQEEENVDDVHMEGPVSTNVAPSIEARNRSTQAGLRKLTKEEIIQLAQERRQKLVKELERVKMQLWETTIEQSVLVELQKQLLP